jgi:hypothetical protein
MDPVTHKPQGEVQYQVIKTGTADPIVTLDEDVAKIPDASASQATVEKFLRLDKFEPGSYTLRIKIIDKNRNKTLTQTAQFTVT